MNHERALLLAEALESGQYEQGYGSLENHRAETPRLCCLGVACRVALAGGVDMTVRMDDLLDVIFNGQDTCLPSSVQDWFGFHDCEGTFRDDDLVDEKFGGRHSLAALNDSGKYDFLAIASIIRENWELL